MTAVVCLLRGVNVGGHNKIKMDALKTLCVSLKLKNPQTFIQSGNVIFCTAEKDLAKLRKKIQDAIAKSFGFRPEVVLRTASELRDVIARNPFAKRSGIEPNRLLVTFLADGPDQESRDKAAAINTGPEELRIIGREAYVYFPNGMARPKMSWPAIEKALKTSGTGRNWNSVTRMLEIAEKLEAL